MDKFKEKTMKDRTASDVDCPFVCMKRKTRQQLRTLFKRKARRILKRELKREIDKE